MPTPRAGSSHLLARLDATPVSWISDSQQGDRGADQRLTEITEIALGPADSSMGDDGWRHDAVTLLDLDVDRIHDPVYQAFLATGLLHPR